MSTELVILLISAVLVVVGAYLWQKGSNLIATGKKSEAIIYKNNFYPDKDGGSVYRPVVRFLTDKQEWITRELSIGFSPPKEEGTRLEVIYDPEDPTIVEVNSRFQLEILPRLFVALGIGGFIFGALEFLGVTQFIS
jgi:hypothetical protein